MAYLIYDIGTGNSRVSIVSEQKEMIGLRTFENRYYRDFRYKDALYFKPEEMLLGGYALYGGAFKGTSGSTDRGGDRNECKRVHRPY